MDAKVGEIFKALQGKRYDLSSEKETQDNIGYYLDLYFDRNQLNPNLKGWFINKEMILSKKDRVDFFIKGPGIAIEVKIKGSPMSFLKQCERYCAHDEVKALILATAKFTGFPEEINGKPIYLLHLSKGML